MKRTIDNINFRGYYEVARASDYLYNSGIRNEIVRAPIQRRQSCSFTIAVNPEDFDKAIKCLSSKNNF